MEARSVIEVVEYDEAWPVRAAAARADLISLGVFDAVEHIGSTSVPGLAAKPVIDLMAAAASLDAAAAARTRWPGWATAGSRSGCRGGCSTTGRGRAARVPAARGADRGRADRGCRRSPSGKS